MEEDHQQSLMNFVCKLCNKKYPSGKSLGGHMRSHVIANLAESDEKIEPNMKKVSTLVNNGAKFSRKEANFGDDVQNVVYGLRENPKKTWRAVDSEFNLSQEKVCKQCGKVFQSLKALCGHMACHSDKERGSVVKDDQFSWSSENQKLVLDSQSDTEAEERKLRSKSKAINNCKRYKRIVIKSSSFALANNDCYYSSSVSEIDEQEQEEVAICLMMLSRDSGNRGGVNSVVESSDNNSVVLESKSSSIEMMIGRRDSLNCGFELDEIPEQKRVDVRKLSSRVLYAENVEPENSDSGYFLGEATNGESYASVDRFHANAGVWECEKAKTSSGVKLEERGVEMRQELKSRGCKMELAKENGLSNGGIVRNSVRYEPKKRSKACFDDETELVADSCKRAKYGSSNAEVSVEPYKRNRYECLNCKKSFKSYQALGGHRPCHKRSSAYLQAGYNSGENSSDAENDTDGKSSGKVGFSKKKASAKDHMPPKSEKKIKSTKHKGHVCPFCHRVFKSGQALGGHKRSHFLGSNAENSNQSHIIKPPVHDLIDLNLPAPVEDEEDGHEQFSSW